MPAIIPGKLTSGGILGGFLDEIPAGIPERISAETSKGISVSKSMKESWSDA